MDHFLSIGLFVDFEISREGGKHKGHAGRVYGAGDHAIGVINSFPHMDLGHFGWHEISDEHAVFDRPVIRFVETDLAFQPIARCDIGVGTWHEAFLDRLITGDGPLFALTAI